MSVNDAIIYYGVMQITELLNKKVIDLPHTADILNDALKKLDPNSENYEGKVKAITEAIVELKKGEVQYNRKELMNKMCCIQQLFDLTSLLTHPATPALPDCEKEKKDYMETGDEDEDSNVEEEEEEDSE
jgi:hypothetical protein